MKVIAKQNRELLLINAQNTQNENKAETLEIEVPEKFQDYNKKIVFDTDDGVVWDVITDNQYKITNAITKYDAVDFYIWLTKDDEDWRSKTKTIKFYDNKDASGEITPEEISGVNTVINLLEDEIDKVKRLNITAEKVGKVTTLTITYKDGTEETFEILDGNDGADGQDGEDYVITPEDYQAIANIVAASINVPTKTSDLTNDSGFIDNTVSNLTNYYNKNQSYNKDEIDGKLSSIYKYKGTVATYSDLPSIDVRVGDVYNVEEDGSNYAWNGTEWDKLGGDVDLSNYYNKTQTDTLLNGKVDNSTLNDYYTKTRTDELLNTKVDKTTYNSKVEEIETELGEKIEESDLADYVKNTDVDNIIQEKSLINQTQLEESQTAQDELISDLKEENKELYDAMAKVTGSGTDVTLNNTAKGKMPIEVSGNTEQENKVSSNLANGNEAYIFRSTSSKKQQVYGNGFLMEYDYDTDYEYHSNYRFAIFNCSLKAGKTYYFNANVENLGSTALPSISAMLPETEQYFNLNNVISPSKDTDWIEIYINNPSFVSGLKLAFTDIMLVESPVAKDYEPYGATAPSPDWESPVKVVTGENTVVEQTKNLIPTNISNWERGHYNTDGIKSDFATRMRLINLLPIKANTTYSVLGSNFYIREFDNEGNFIKNIGTVYSNDIFETSSNASYLGISVEITYSNYIENVNQIAMFFNSETNKVWEKGEITLFPLNLGSIELCKIGEYKDYPWKDESTGKWYIKKKIDKSILNGSENWTENTSTVAGGTIFQLNKKDIIRLESANDKGLVISDYYTTISPSIAWMQLISGITNLNGDNYIRIRNVDITDLNTFKTWLSTHNTIVYYVLATPTDIEITNTTLINQLEAIYNTAKSYKGTTHIYTEVEEGNVAPILDATAIMDLNSLVQN